MSRQPNAASRALVVGATGIAGQTTARHLVENGWTTFGLTRRGETPEPRVEYLTADLLDPGSLEAVVAGTAPELVVITAWMRRDSEQANIEANSAIVRNLLMALEPERTVRHVALLTGLKHYLGPFEAYGRGVMADTPFHEYEPRQSSPNFYYAQEDELFESSARNGFTWSVHRAHSILGFAVGNAMNMVLTLGVYATLCRELGLPFIFPGSATQWNGVNDVTDADLLADQIIWAATDPRGANEAFNVVNGDVFRWRWLWPRIARMLEVEPDGFDTEPRPLAHRMRGMESEWRRIARKHGLVEHDINRLASWWHTDSDLGRDVESFADMGKSREAGFLAARSTESSFAEKLTQYRAAGILP